MWTWLIGAGVIIVIVGLHLGEDKLNANRLDKARTAVAELKADKLRLEGEKKDLSDANTSNQASIAALVMANEAWASIGGDLDERIAELNIQLAGERADHDRKQAESRARIDKALQEDAKEWGGGDLPGSIAVELCSSPAAACTH